jgi:protein XagA
MRGFGGTVAKSRMRLALLLGAALMPQPALGGAWTLQGGTGQVVVTGTASQATEAFDGGGRLQGTARYSKVEVQTLLEYGISDWLTLMLAPGLQAVDVGAPVDASRAGFGYSEFGARAMLLRNANWVLSGQATMRVPGTSDTTNSAAIGYTGAEIDIRGLFGMSFEAFAMPAFVDVQLAQRFRTGDPPDETRLDLTFGLRTSQRWLVLAQSFNVISQGAGASALFPSYNYHKLQLSALYELTPQWALQGGLFTTFAGRNALQENGVVLGAWYRFPGPTDRPPVPSSR